MSEYIIASAEAEYAAAAALFKEYSLWLDVDLCFQSFEKELEALPKMYGPDDGGIILCKAGNVFIGCVAIRRIDEATAELKRMWVRPAFQKKGIGQRLLQEALLMAKNLHYKLIRLDTVTKLQPAIALYKKNGFIETTAYYKNPLKEVVYMEKEIG